MKPSSKRLSFFLDFTFLILFGWLSTVLSLSPKHSLQHLLEMRLFPPRFFAVPFREAPAYSKRRRGPSSGDGSGDGQSASSLSAPRVLLRSNSDNNLTVSQYQQQHGSPGNWAPHLQQHQHAQHQSHRAPQQGHSQPGSSALHRSLSPQLLQQMPSGSPNGNVVVRTMGRGARSRSPSLSRLGEEARRAAPSQRQPRWASSGHWSDGLFVFEKHTL